MLKIKLKCKIKTFLANYKMQSILCSTSMLQYNQAKRKQHKETIMNYNYNSEGPGAILKVYGN
jgi:hypothetical protein